jgi:hypothetical protein
LWGWVSGWFFFGDAGVFGEGRRMGVTWFLCAGWRVSLSSLLASSVPTMANSRLDIC